MLCETWGCPNEKGKCKDHDESKICVIKGCTYKRKTKLFCRKHAEYKQQQKEVVCGSLLPKEVETTSKSEQSEILKRIEKLKAQDKRVPEPDKLPVREIVYRISSSR